MPPSQGVCATRPPQSMRIVSFDLLRGLAALGVAIPHLFLLFNHSVVWEGISILAVEIFFALSGFVLAPQIIYLHRHASNYNLWVFFLRRWIRTVTPYLIALTFIAFLTGHLFSWQFLAKAFFVDTFYQVSTKDFFAISWSLAVEEWYYVTAALLVFVFRTPPLTTLFLVAVSVLFAVKVGGIFLDENWTVSVRRATIYRLDAIAFGFLMFLWHGKLSGEVSKVLFATLAITVILLLLLYAFKENIGGIGNIWLLLAVYGLSVFSLSIVHSFYLLNHLFISGWINSVSTFLGAISYPVYLFHLPIGYAVLTLKLPLSQSILIGTVLVVVFAWLFHELVEKRFIDARPVYLEKLNTGNPPPPINLPTPRSILNGFTVTIVVTATIIVMTEFISQWYLSVRQPTLVNTAFYSSRNMGKAGTRHIFGALDPQLGYAHPRRLRLKTKKYAVSQRRGYGVHVPKKGDSYKVFILGGSTSDPFISVQKRVPPWSKYLHDSCRAKQNCGVWNGAVGGYGSPQELLRLVRDIVPENPDLVLSLHGPNELNRIARQPLMTGYHTEQVKAEAKKGKIWFGGVLPNMLSALAYIRNNDDIPDRDREIYYGFRYQEDPFTRWKRNVEMMSAIADSQNIQYFTILQPLVGYSTYKPSAAVLKAAGRRGKAYYKSVDTFYQKATAFCSTINFCIDISRVFDGRDENLYRDIRHPNDAGNKIIAEAVAAELRNRGVFK